jgi:hypothetical protein
MKVPTVDQSVGVNVPTVQPVQVPGAIPGAFGENVAEATAKFGQDIAGVGEKMGQLAIQQADQQAKVRDAKLENDYITGWQNRLYNLNSETVKDLTGKDITRPRGYLARTLDQVDPNMPTSMIQDNADFVKTILEQEPNKQRRAELAIKLNNHFLSIRENGIQHTVNETRKAAENTFQQTSLNYIDSATLSNTPESLTGSIHNIMLNNKAWENRIGKGAAWLIQQNHDDIEKALWKATDGVLESTGDVERAKQLLNDPSLKDLIPEDLYEATEVKLDQRNKRIGELIKWNTKVTQTQGAFDLSQGLIDGTLTPEKVKAYQQTGKIDTDTAAIFDTVIRKVDFQIPETTTLGKPDYFLRLLDQSLNNKTEAIKVLKDATEAYGKGDMGANQYAYFIQEANKKFAREKQGLSGWEKSMDYVRNNAHALKDFATFISPVNQIKISGDMITKLIQRVIKGEDPTLATQAIQKETVLQYHPQAVTYPEEGKKIIDSDSNTKIILPDGTIKDIEQKKESPTSGKK